MCLFLWQANSYPVLGLGSEKINNGNIGPSNNPIATMKIEVQRGESLWVLAQRYQTTVDELVELNQVKTPDQIREGQILWIPSGETQETSNETSDKTPSETSSTQVNEAEDVQVAEKVTYTPWWVNILRGIPRFTTVFNQKCYNIADSRGFPPALLVPKNDTYEIFVNQPTELSEKVLTSSLPETKDDSQQVIERAVAAIPSNSQIHSRGLGRLVSQEEVELLSRVIYGEARGEDFLGQVAVGAVVLNRLNDSRFPKTIRGVIYQSGAFTAVDDRQIHLEPNDQAYKAAEAALSGLDPTNGAIFYYNPRTATDQWIKSRTVIKRIGNHTFSI